MFMTGVLCTVCGAQVYFICGFLRLTTNITIIPYHLISVRLNAYSDFDISVAFVAYDFTIDVCMGVPQG